MPFFNTISDAYNLLFLLPGVFLLVYGLVYSPLLKQANIRYSTWIIVFFSWLKCTLMPFLGVITKQYLFPGTFSTAGSTKIAIMLISYEQIIVGLTFLIYSQGKRKDIKNLETDIRLAGSIPAYIVFIIAATGIFFRFGDLNSVEFVVKSASTGVRSGDVMYTGHRLLNAVISAALLFTFLILTEKMRQANELKKKGIYSTVSMIMAMLMIAIIFDERRATQLYTAFCTIWLLTRVFPERKRKIIITLVSVAGFVLVMMSIYKFFNAFVYGYRGALSRTNIDLLWISRTLESYFFGVQTNSNNVGFADVAHLGIKNMFFDFGRSTFGLSFLLKNRMLTTSEIYNSTLYLGNQKTGMLFSSVAYGYLYLGPIFAPIMTVLNILILLNLETALRKCRSMEMTYIVSFAFARFGFTVFHNTPPLISSASTFFAINGLIFLAGRMFQKIQEPTYQPLMKPSDYSKSGTGQRIKT